MLGVFHILLSWGSVVGIVTHYRLDGPGIESWFKQDFLHPSRPALGPAQPPGQSALGLFPRGEATVRWGSPLTPI